MLTCNENPPWTNTEEEQADYPRSKAVRLVRIKGDQEIPRVNQRIPTRLKLESIQGQPEGSTIEKRTYEARSRLAKRAC